MIHSRKRRPAGILLIVWIVAGLLLPGLAQARDSDTVTFETIDRYVEEQMEASRIPGVAVSITEGDEVVYSEGFGHTSRGQEPVTPQTLFSIGSTTKSMTALAVMQLVEVGQIDLDEPVQRYIPWFRLADPLASGEVTVRHLLTMTSGIPANAGGEAFRSTEPMSPEQAIRSLQSAEFSDTPGSTFEYVNANYVILGHLIEIVSGESYGDYLRAHVFGPLEMNDTYTDLSQAEAAGYAPGHRYWFGWPVEHDIPQHPALLPSGYVISTAGDLSRYLAMYLNDGVYNGERILSQAGIAELQRGVVDAPLGPWADPPLASYAMGWYAGGPWGDGSMIFHPGSSPTFTAMLIIDPESDRGVVTLINVATEMPLPGAAGSLRVLPAGVMDILMDEQPGNVGLGRFYLFFDIVVLSIVAIQVLSLTRLARRGVTIDLRASRLRRAARVARAAVPLVWELGLGFALLVAPSALGMSWQSVRLWTPDLGLVLFAVAILWLITGGYRALLIGRVILARRRHGAAVIRSSVEAEVQRPAV